MHNEILYNCAAIYCIQVEVSQFHNCFGTSRKWNVAILQLVRLLEQPKAYTNNPGACKYVCIYIYIFIFIFICIFYVSLCNFWAEKDPGIVTTSLTFPVEWSRMFQAATASACASSGEALLGSDNVRGELYFLGISSNFFVPRGTGRISLWLVQVVALCLYIYI